MSFPAFVYVLCFVLDRSRGVQKHPGIIGRLSSPLISRQSSSTTSALEITIVIEKKSHQRKRSATNGSWQRGLPCETGRADRVSFESLARLKPMVSSILVLIRAGLRAMVNYDLLLGRCRRDETTPERARLCWTDTASIVAVS